MTMRFGTAVARGMAAALLAAALASPAPAEAQRTSGPTRTQTDQPGEPITGLPGGAPGRTTSPTLPGGGLLPGFGLGGTAPSAGLAPTDGPPEPIEVRFRAFIPSPALVVSPDDPADLLPTELQWLARSPFSTPLGRVSAATRCLLSTIANLDDCLFRGDNRGYSYDGGTHRVIQSVLIQQGVAPQVFMKFCRTHEYDRFQGQHVAGRPWWWFKLNPSAREAASDQLQVSRANSFIDITFAPSRTMLHFILRGANPLVNGPPIDADFTIFVYYNPGQAITAVAKGSHDGFPAYEIYVNGQMLRGTGIPYNPAERAGASPLSLFTNDINQIQVFAGPQTITGHYSGGRPPDPPECN